MADPAAKRQEERVKLIAAALSNLGVASLVTGLVGPLFLGRAQVAAGVVALVMGFAFHLAGQGVLHYVVRDGGPEDV